MLQAARVAAEGLVGVAASESAAVLVELNCETDFVARNPKFQASAGAGLLLDDVLTLWPQALLTAVAASALKLDYSSLQPRCVSVTLVRLPSPEASPAKRREHSGCVTRRSGAGA